MSNFADERHNLYVGWVLGFALKFGIPAEPVLDDAGNYTDRLRLVLDDVSETVRITIVVPPPPDDWKLDADARCITPAPDQGVA